MKKIYAILAIACAPFWATAQCSLQVTTVNVSCYGACDGQATAQMTGTPPFTYMWMPLFVNGPTVTNLCEGMYQVDGTDA
ncbi:MAG TPA: SprB repeat-containing protein, partial [Bacteroidia bacterium]|nr:SprB repeat-containing protein [Bacteroidia bacterium]